MFVIIIGGGKTGSQLAATLLEEKHQIRIIEERPLILEKLRSELPGNSVLAGDGSSPAILEAAGIRSANVLAAVTGDDEANLVICSLAKFEFDVPRVISRINNPKNAWLFNEGMGVDVALNQSEILSRLIAEEMSLGDMMTLLKLRKGEYSMVEEKVHPTSGAIGKQLSQISFPT
ncbi:MAG TPA: TrkA family potassium uptake protein, partial [Leptolinea sp.]